MPAEKTNRIFSFRTQRVLATFIIFGIAFLFTTAILWGHIESVLPRQDYQRLAKAGLLLLPTVALIMTLWELFVHKTDTRRFQPHPTVTRLTGWCFFGALILLVAELIHAGALMKYDSSIKNQTANMKAAGEVQAGIEAARIKAAGETAAELNRRGQTRSARRALTLGSADKGSTQAILEKTQNIQGETFLPDWYIGGGMYVALPVLAALFFAITMFFARQAQCFIDANDNGIPDVEENQPGQGTPAQTNPPSRQAGFVEPVPVPTGTVRPNQPRNYNVISGDGGGSLPNGQSR